MTASPLVRREMKNHTMTERIPEKFVAEHPIRMRKTMTSST